MMAVDTPPIMDESFISLKINEGEPLLSFKAVYPSAYVIVKPDANILVAPVFFMEEQVAIKYKGDNNRILKLGLYTRELVGEIKLKPNGTLEGTYISTPDPFNVKSSAYMRVYRCQ